MTTTVTMLQTRLGESGSLWTVGNSYAASDAFAAVLISSNLATGTLPKSRSLVPLWGQTDNTGAVTSVVDAGGNVFLTGVGATVSILGDSITQENYEQTSTTITERSLWFSQANSLLGQRMVLTNNAGVSGETAAQILARVQANGTGLGVGFGGIGQAGVAVTTSPSPLYGSPRFVFIHAGVNDIYGGSLSALEIWTTIKQIIQAVINGGAIPVVLTVMPVTTGTVGYTTARAVVHLAVNDYIRSYCTANKKAILIDAFAAMVDPTNASVACVNGVTRDSKQHPNNLGGLMVARAIQSVMQNLIPPVGILPSSNAATYALDPAITQILPNPLLTGTAAITATGYSGTTAGSTLGNGNFVRGGTPTCVLSAVTRADGYGQNIKFVPTFSAANDSLEVRFPTQHASVVAGGKYIAVCEITVTGPSGVALTAAHNLQGVQLYIQCTTDAVNNFSYAEGRASTDVALVGSFTKVLRTPVLTVPAGSTTVFRPNLAIYGAGIGSPEIQLGRIGLIRVG